MEAAYIGCSIAVNGVCLTVTAFDKTSFTVNCAPETLRLTNLSELHPGLVVNLERAMLADGRNSGHTVQGHVDGVGTVVGQRPDGEALWVTIGVPPSLAKYIVKKGYIAVDGGLMHLVDLNTPSLLALIQSPSTCHALRGWTCGVPASPRPPERGWEKGV